ncbi:MAG TPA: methylmalonyl-CoA mutase family protein [Acidimicrobiia bacterium]|nr:methylmalonyl-CoA mutase family protein [Acidimicrobiia bacterium]
MGDAPERSTEFETMSDVPAGRAEELPGGYPYARGPYASMHRSKPWTMRMGAVTEAPVL